MKKYYLILLMLFASTSLAMGSGVFNPPQLSDNYTITGGTIDNTPIGSTTPAAGSFTTGLFSNLVNSATNRGFRLYYGAGTATTPVYTFVTDADTGLYSDTANTLGFSTAATSRAVLDASGYFNINNLSVGLGSAALPGLSFQTDTNTGIYGDGSDGIYISTAGNLKLAIPASGIPLSYVSCGAGFSRVGLNFCVKEDGTAGLTALTRDTCTLVTDIADAKAYIIKYSAIAKSANVAATSRFAYVEAFSDASCTVHIGDSAREVSAAGYEFTAVAAGAHLDYAINESVLYKSGDSTIYMLFSDDAGDQGSGYYGVIGYAQ